MSAAFHSKFMLKAQDVLSREIQELNFIENKIKITTKLCAKVIDPDANSLFFLYGLSLSVLASSKSLKT